MRFLFQCRDDVLEALDVGGGHTANHCSFEIGQMAVDSLRQPSPLYCQRDDERTAIRLPNFSGNQSTVG